MAPNFSNQSTHAFCLEQRNGPGGQLDPQAAILIDQMKQQDTPPIETMTPKDMREAIEGRVDKTGGEKIEVGRVEDRSISGPGGEIGLRVFTPPGEGPFPALLYFHGGGWVTCNSETHDPPCRQVCQHANGVVVSVDYRLAPEHKFPAANEDAMAALEWLADHGEAIQVDPARIAVGGDSAGGQMATVLALRCRDEGGPSIAMQVLIYPVTDLSRMKTQSYRDYAEGYFLSKPMMEWFRRHYLNTLDEAQSIHASPLLAEDLSGLPPAMVITAEFDPLRDEGEAYARRLHEAGVPVRCVRYNGLFHPFWSMGGVLHAAHDGYKEVARTLQVSI